MRYRLRAFRLAAAAAVTSLALNACVAAAPHPDGKSLTRTQLRNRAIFGCLCGAGVAAFAFGAWYEWLDSGLRPVAPPPSHGQRTCLPMLQSRAAAFTQALPDVEASDTQSRLDLHKRLTVGDVVTVMSNPGELDYEDRLVQADLPRTWLGDYDSILDQFPDVVTFQKHVEVTQNWLIRFNPYFAAQMDAAGKTLPLTLATPWLIETRDYPVNGSKDVRNQRKLVTDTFLAGFTEAQKAELAEFAIEPQFDPFLLMNIDTLIANKEEDTITFSEQPFFFVRLAPRPGGSAPTGFRQWFDEVQEASSAPELPMPALSYLHNTWAKLYDSEGLGDVFEVEAQSVRGFVHPDNDANWVVYVGRPIQLASGFATDADLVHVPSAPMAVLIVKPEPARENRFEQPQTIRHDYEGALLIYGGSQPKQTDSNSFITTLGGDSDFSAITFDSETFGDEGPLACDEPAEAVRNNE